MLVYSELPGLKDSATGEDAIKSGPIGVSRQD